MPYFKPTKYYKDNSFDPIYKEVNVNFLLRTRLFPVFLPLLGVLLFLTQVAIPLISFKTQDDIAEPVRSSALGVASGFYDFEFTELREQEDEKVQSRVLGKTTSSDDEKYFRITVPELGIINALVEINEPTLKPDTALGHYTNSALPGEPGNTFVYGHSVLPFFYNPKNYKTIFSTLGKLETGDLIYVEYKGENLTYKVEGKRELKPNKVDPLADIKPKFLNESTMVLMTCSPAGTKINRLMIDTVLIERG